MLKNTLITSILLILLFSNGAISQKTEVWTLAKSTELNQPFGYVWSYNNTPQQVSINETDHHHTHVNNTSTKPSLKKSFLVNESSYILKYSGVGVTNTITINYAFLDKNGNTVVTKNITFTNSPDKTWNKTTIDLSAYLNTNLTLVVSIVEIPENTSLFINLFQ